MALAHRLCASTLILSGYGYAAIALIAARNDCLVLFFILPPVHRTQSR